MGRAATAGAGQGTSAGRQQGQQIRTNLTPDSLVHGTDLARGGPVGGISAGPWRRADSVVERHLGRLVVCLGSHGAKEQGRRRRRRVAEVVVDAESTIWDRKGQD